MDRSTWWALDRAAEALPLLRRQPTKREACSFAAIWLWCMQRATRRALSLARRERTRTNSGPYLNSASSSARTLQRNSGAAASAPQSGGKLNRRQSFAPAVCAENSIDNNHGVYGVFWPQSQGKTNLQSPMSPSRESLGMGQGGAVSQSCGECLGSPFRNAGNSIWFPHFILINADLTFR